MAGWTSDGDKKEIHKNPKLISPLNYDACEHEIFFHPLRSVHFSIILGWKVIHGFHSASQRTIKLTKRFSSHPLIRQILSFLNTIFAAFYCYHTSLWHGESMSEGWNIKNSLLRGEKHNINIRESSQSQRNFPFFSIFISPLSS